MKRTMPGDRLSRACRRGCSSISSRHAAGAAGSPRAARPRTRHRHPLERPGIPGRALDLIRATLSRNKVTFPGKTGEVSGFAAGIRLSSDLAAGRGHDHSGLAALLSTRPISRAGSMSIWPSRNPTAALEDWIDSRGQSDKNTTETDQETSAVRAAADIVRVLGPGLAEANRRRNDRPRAARPGPPMGRPNGASTANAGS